MNLVPDGAGADYVNTGSWAKKAIAEAKRVGKRARVAASTEEEGFSRVPTADELDVDPAAAYLHYTGNETIGGVEWPEPPSAGDVPLICDASSHFLSRPWPVASHALVYAGAQKNVAPAGVTIVIVRKDMLERVPEGLPTMLDYKLMAENKSLYNTPPVFCIYVVELTCKWIESQGGLEEMGKKNQAKAKLLYDALDASEGFYRGHAKAGSRSNMNVTWTMASEELEKKLIAEASQAGFDGLKGHRSVGGLRASIYNAFPHEGVEALVGFLADFRAKNG